MNATAVRCTTHENPLGNSVMLHVVECSCIFTLTLSHGMASSLIHSALLAVFLVSGCSFLSTWIPISPSLSLSHTRARTHTRTDSKQETVGNFSYRFTNWGCSWKASCVVDSSTMDSTTHQLHSAKHQNFPERKHWLRKMRKPSFSRWAPVIYN